MTIWKSGRQTTNTSWQYDRTSKATYSRKYVLGSFFELIKTIITDPKDGKALLIKTDPKYYIDTPYGGRRSNGNTVWRVRI